MPNNLDMVCYRGDLSNTCECPQDEEQSNSYQSGKCMQGNDTENHDNICGTSSTELIINSHTFSNLYKAPMQSFMFHTPQQRAHTLSDFEIATIVMKTGKLNSIEAKIPVSSNWNLQLFESLCTSDSDHEVLTFLRYGWPLNWEAGPMAQTWESQFCN